MGWIINMEPVHGSQCNCNVMHRRSWNHDESLHGPQHGIHDGTQHDIRRGDHGGIHQCIHHDQLSMMFSGFVHGIHYHLDVIIIASIKHLIVVANY